MVQRRYCESLYASGRVEDAKEVLLKMLDTFGEEMHARNWVIGGYRRLNQMGLSNVYFQISKGNVPIDSNRSVIWHSAPGSTTRRSDGTHLPCLSIIQTR